MLSRQQAIAELTAAGSPFELETAAVYGHPVRVFKNAPASLRDVWLTAAARGNVPYFIYDDAVLTYEDAHKQVTSLAAWLVSRGVSKGARVALGMRNYPEWVIAYWALQCIGAVMVSLNAWWVADELKYALSDSGATALIVDGERLERLSSELLEESGVATVLVARGSGRPGVFLWDDITSHTSAQLPDVAIAPDDDATILYTSGTTGQPKGAAGSHRNYITNMWNGLFSQALASKMAGAPPAQPDTPKPQVVALSTFPFFHIAGLCGMNANTNNGVCIITQYKWDAGDALRLVEKYKVNTFGGVPTVVRSFLEHPQFADFDLSSLTAISQGGAPVPPDSIARIESEFAGKVGAANGYGLTETTAAVIGNSGAAYFSKKDSVGLPFVGTDVRIVSEEGKDVPVGGVGEVWVYGPNNVRGYWNKPVETEKAFTNGWFHTGDAGYIDEDGYVYVVDRIKDMVLRGGENVYCVEVETVLFEHPSVGDCAVIGLPHDKLGEEVAAVLVPADGADTDSDAVLSLVKSRLAAFKVPSKVFWQSEPLPRNATGKVLKKDLRDTYSTTQG
jgi:acyl-CoA synthetase (AMP-forming)/AMP-acid ligase II